MQLPLGTTIETLVALPVVILGVREYFRMRGPHLAQMPFGTLKRTAKRQYTKRVRPYLGDIVRNRDENDPIQESLAWPYLRTWLIQFSSVKEIELSSQKIRLEMWEGLESRMRMIEQICLQKGTDFASQVRIVEEWLSDRARHSNHATDINLLDQFCHYFTRSSVAKNASRTKRVRPKRVRRTSEEVIFESWIGIKLEYIDFFTSILIPMKFIRVTSGKLEMQDGNQANFARFVRREGLSTIDSFLATLKFANKDDPVTNSDILNLCYKKTPPKKERIDTEEICMLFDMFKQGQLKSKKHI